MTRTELWEKLWGEYITKLQRIDELKRQGRYGYQLRMPYKSLAIAEKALLKEFPEAEKYMNPGPSLKGNGSKYDRILSVFRLLNEESLKQGRRELAYRDFSPASFSMEDVADVDIDGGVLSFSLKDGRSWKGDIRDLKPFEESVLSNWVEVKAMEAGLGSPVMGGYVYDDDDVDLVDVPRPEGSVKGAVLSHKDLMLIISHARDAMDHGDLYRALELLEVFFEKAHYWLRNFGSDSILQKTMDAARSLAAQVRSKMSQTSLKGPLMGLHTQEEQIQAVDMAADSLARGIDAAASRNLFGLASEVGYLRALADLALSEGVEALATIAHQNANELVARFGQIYGEIG